MDLDAKIAGLENRVKELESKFFDLVDHVRRGGVAPRDESIPSGKHPAIERKNSARQHVEAGDWDAAAHVLGLDRGNGESEESHQRRLKAEVYGAKDADAERPRPTGEEKKSLDKAGSLNKDGTVKEGALRLRPDGDEHLDEPDLGRIGVEKYKATEGGRHPESEGGRVGLIPGQADPDMPHEPTLNDEDTTGESVGADPVIDPLPEQMPEEQGGDPAPHTPGGEEHV